MKRSAVLFVFIILFLLFGTLVIGDVSLIEGERRFSDQLFFLKRHLAWTIIGLLGCLLMARTDYHVWQRFVKIGYIFLLVALILVLIPEIGVLAYGARRWLSLGSFTFQPSEFMKLFLILFLSSLLHSDPQQNLLKALGVLILPVVLVAIEPDMGTAAVMFAIGMTVIFLSGVDWFKILFPVLLFLFLGTLFVYLSSYRWQRVLSLLDPFYDPQNRSYHAYQLVLTLGSGGLWGVGMGGSRQKYLYLPQVTSDSIMAVVAEEFGFVGISIFLILFLFFIFWGAKVFLSTYDLQEKLIVGGVLSWLVIQGLVNLSAVAILLPLTGVPFPLISYGGSSLISILLGLGVLINISLRNEKNKSA